MSRSATNTKRKNAMKAQQRNDLRKQGGCCGATTKKGTICTLQPGFGTDHPGRGNCKYHGGATRTHRQGPLRSVALALATPRETDPAEAIATALNATMGEFIVATAQVAALDDGELFVDTIAGKVPNHWIRLREQLADRLVRYAKVAADAGIAERAQSLRESQAELVAGFLNAVLADIGLTPAQREQVGPAMRRHLALVSSVPGTATEIGREDAA